MSIVGKIHFRDLTQLLPLHRVVISPASDTAENTWMKIIAYPSLTYWTASSIGFVFLMPPDMESADWREWYVPYAGLNYYFFQYWLIYDEDTQGIFVFVEGRSPSFSSVQIALGDLPSYSSDAAAAAGGLAIGDFYVALEGHDRAVVGSITKRLD